MTGQCLQSQQQTRERSHVSHYQGKVTAYPVTHRFHWPVTTIRHHQAGIITFNRFYLGPTSNMEREWMGFSNYFCLNTRGEAQTLAWRRYLESLYFHSPLKLLVRQQSPPPPAAVVFGAIFGFWKLHYGRLTNKLHFG